MPIMARRPFLISERRFSASCWELSFLVKPGVSQTATVRRDAGQKACVRGVAALNVAPQQRHWCTSRIRSTPSIGPTPRRPRRRGVGGAHSS